MNINSWQERMAWHDAFGDALCEHMASDQFINAFVRAGGENSPLSACLALIRSIGGPMATRIRREPDGKLIIERNLAHWDAKAAKTIEKDAWLEYDKLTHREEPVLLFVAPDLLDEPPRAGPVFTLLFTDLILEHGAFTAMNFDKNKQFPVDEEGWLYPRKHIEGTPRGSGTPYRKMDLWRTPKLCIFKARRNANGIVHLSGDLFVADTLTRTLADPNRHGRYTRKP